MSEVKRRLRRSADAWLHSDLVSIPLIVALAGVVVVLVGVIMAIGEPLGVFVDKLVFPIALGLILILGTLLVGGRRESTAGLAGAPAGAARRVVVIANEGLEAKALCETVCDRAQELAGEVMIVAPVVASSRLREIADDIDVERDAAQGRVDAALAMLQKRGIPSRGHVDMTRPVSALVDGMREFPPTEILMLRGGEPGWDEAENLAGRIRADLGVPVTEVAAS